MPVNWRLAADELQYILGHGEARLLLADAAFWPVASALKLPTVKQRVCVDGPQADAPDFEAWHAGAPDHFTPVAAGLQDAALQLYSSGTTGLPNGVVLTHEGLLYSAEVVVDQWRVGTSSVVGNPLPNFHIAGINMALRPLHCGACSSLYAKFDPAGFIAAIGQHGITHAFLVPAMVMFVLQSPTARTGNYRSLQLIAYGGSPVSETVLTQALQVFGCGLLQVYGLTELSGSATFLMPEDHHTSGAQAGLLRSSGRAISGTRLRIVDPRTLQDLPDGQTGEVWIESHGTLREYWRNPEVTAAAYSGGRSAAGGWFRSDDGGYVPGGCLYIHDRIKDMVISGGENIYRAEIENLLMAHPAVADGAIIGVPDDIWGEAVKAIVVLRPGQALTASALIADLRARLARYKCPKSVDCVEALPRNPSGKILKRVLRQPYWADRSRGV